MSSIRVRCPTGLSPLGVPFPAPILSPHMPDPPISTLPPAAPVPWSALDDACLLCMFDDGGRDGGDDLRVVAAALSDATGVPRTLEACTRRLHALRTQAAPVGVPAAHDTPAAVAAAATAANAATAAAAASPAAAPPAVRQRESATARETQARGSIPGVGAVRTADSGWVVAPLEIAPATGRVLPPSRDTTVLSVEEIENTVHDAAAIVRAVEGATAESLSATAAGSHADATSAAAAQGTRRRATTTSKDTDPSSPRGRGGTAKPVRPWSKQEDDVLVRFVKDHPDWLERCDDIQYSLNLNTGGSRRCQEIVIRTGLLKDLGRLQEPPDSASPRRSPDGRQVQTSDDSKVVLANGEEDFQPDGQQLGVPSKESHKKPPKKRSRVSRDDSPEGSINGTESESEIRSDVPLFVVPGEKAQQQHTDVTTRADSDSAPRKKRKARRSNIVPYTPWSKEHHDLLFEICRNEFPKFEPGKPNWKRIAERLQAATGVVRSHGAVNQRFHNHKLKEGM